MKYARFLIVGALTLAVAYSSFSAALATIAASTNPQLALKFAPENPTAHVVYADSLASGEADLRILSQLKSHAKASLLTQAINPRGLRLLSTAVVNGRNEQHRIRLLQLAEKLSRREIGTQILLIEQGAQTDNINETLRHYDVALTTKEEVKATLFPVLASAIEDPAINQAFARYFSSGRLWVPEFTSYKFARDKNSNALATATLATRSKVSFPEFETFKPLFFDRALRTDQLATARKFNARYRVVDPSLLTSASFPSSFDTKDALAGWRLFELPYALPQFVQEAPNKPLRLNVVASSGARGLIASKLLVLKPGSYRFYARYGNVALVSGASISWALKCLNDERLPVVWQSSATPVATLQYAQPVTIPEQCRAQALDLIISAAGDQSESSMDIVSVVLAPTQGKASAVAK